MIKVFIFLSIKSFTLKAGAVRRTEDKSKYASSDFHGAKEKRKPQLSDFQRHSSYHIDAISFSPFDADVLFFSILRVNSR